MAMAMAMAKVSESMATVSYDSLKQNEVVSYTSLSLIDFVLPTSSAIGPVETARGKALV